MDVLLSNKFEEEKHRAKGMGKGHLQYYAIEMCYEFSNF
jgi:hypothetical protein